MIGSSIHPRKAPPPWTSHTLPSPHAELAATAPVVSKGTGFTIVQLSSEGGPGRRGRTRLRKHPCARRPSWRMECCIGDGLGACGSSSMHSTVLTALTRTWRLPGQNGKCARMGRIIAGCPSGLRFPHPRPHRRGLSMRLILVGQTPHPGLLASGSGGPTSTKRHGLVSPNGHGKSMVMRVPTTGRHGCMPTGVHRLYSPQSPGEIFVQILSSLRGRTGPPWRRLSSPVHQVVTRTLPAMAPSPGAPAAGRV